MRDHLEELLRAVGYIESHLDGPFRLAGTAREAGMSAFHFSRVFASVTGEPASGDARKRGLLFSRGGSPTVPATNPAPLPRSGYRCDHKRDVID